MSTAGSVRPGAWDPWVAPSTRKRQTRGRREHRARPQPRTAVGHIEWATESPESTAADSLTREPRGHACGGPLARPLLDDAISEVTVADIVVKKGSGTVKTKVEVLGGAQAVTSSILWIRDSVHPDHFEQVRQVKNAADPEGELHEVGNGLDLDNKFLEWLWTATPAPGSRSTRPMMSIACCVPFVTTMSSAVARTPRLIPT